MPPMCRLTAGRLQDPYAEPVDQTSFFCKRDKLVRTHQFEVWMLPADQGLRSGYSSRGDVHLGLIAHKQLAGNCLAQIRNQGKTTGDLFRYFQIEKLTLFFSCYFGSVHGDIRALEQFVYGSAVVRENAGTDTGHSVTGVPSCRIGSAMISISFWAICLTSAAFLISTTPMVNSFVPAWLLFRLFARLRRYVVPLTATDCRLSGSLRCR